MSISIAIPQLPTANMLAEIASKSTAIARAAGLPSSDSVTRKVQLRTSIAAQQPIGGGFQFIGDGPLDNDYPVGW